MSASDTPVALVTGGETGIGKAIAEALTEAGYAVRVASRRTGTDLRDPAAIEALVAELPRLDVLVNNAGVAESAPLEKTTDEQWERHLELNATAAFRLARASLPLLEAAPRGHIVNIASTAALRGDPYIAAYTASKHALLGLSRALASELRGIAVDAVCPGYVDTPLTDRTIARIVGLTDKTEHETRAWLASQNPSGRLVRPDEVAEAVLRLLREEGTGREVVLE